MYQVYFLRQYLGGKKEKKKRRTKQGSEGDRPHLTFKRTSFKKVANSSCHPLARRN